MKKLFFLIIGLLLVSYAFSGNVANQNVSLSVEKISKLSLSGRPTPFTVVEPSSLNPIRSKVDSSTTMNITTNVDGQKITAQLNNGLPDHCFIYCKVGIDGKYHRLSMNPTILKENINRGIKLNLPVAFKFEAELGAEVGPEQSREIHFTLISM
ncbi:MAG: hypothetical protein P0S95_08290 [Rhabdochlamydiaceae bacterium]|nr:hypothetical protein [Candidatus Amphrikana amoebophyrae]